MRRPAHVFGRLRLAAGACLLFAVAFAIGLELLPSGGGDQPGNASTERPAAVAAPVSIERPAHQSAASVGHPRQNSRGADRSAAARPQPPGQARPPAQARPDGDSRPGPRSGAGLVVSRAGVPRGDSAQAKVQASPTAIGRRRGESPHGVPALTGTTQRRTTHISAQYGYALTARPRPPLVRTPPASARSGQPWKPASAPSSIPEIPRDQSGSELMFFCFIAQAAAAGCNGAPASVSVSLQDPSITADGQSSTTATITVKDAGGSLVTSDVNSISLSATPDPSSPSATVTFGQVMANADGTYSATITSGTTAGAVGITATDSSVTPNITSPSAQLILKSPNALPAANVSVQLNPSSIIANGTSATTATATVTAADGTVVAGDKVQFSAAGQPVGAPCATNSSGQCSISILSTTQATSRAITAADTSVSPNITSQPVTLAQTAGPAAKLTLNFGSNSLLADGKSTTSATATVTDANGNPVANDSVKFAASNGAVTIGPTCTTVSNGQCTVTVTSNTTAPGTVTITATDASVITATNQATLTLASTIGQAANIQLTLTNPSNGNTVSSVPADGKTTITATAIVTDAASHPVSNDSVSIVAVQGAGLVTTPGSTTQLGGGKYSTIFTVGAQAGTVTIKATDNSVVDASHNPTLFTSQTLTLTSTSVAAPGAASVAVSVTPTAIFADGVSHAFATAQVDDSAGNPVPGDAVQFFVNAQPFGSICITDSSGMCHITLASTTVVGIETISAVDDSAGFLQSENSVVLSFVPQPPPSGGGTGPTTTSTPTPTTPAHPRAPSPSASKIKASLASVLGAKGASIEALLKKGSHPIPYRALTAGKLTIEWWDGPAAGKPKLIASVTVMVSKAKTLVAKLTLTGTGRLALKHSDHLKVKSAASFKPSGKPTVSRSDTFTLY